jgi:hypothetical protein
MTDEGRIHLEAATFAGAPELGAADDRLPAMPGRIIDRSSALAGTAERARRRRTATARSDA